MAETREPLIDALSEVQSLGNVVNLETGWLMRWGLEGFDATRVLGTAVSPRVRLERVRDALARIASGGRPFGVQADEDTPFVQRVSALGALIGLADERALGAHALPACRRAIGGRSGDMIHGVAGAALGESLRAANKALFGVRTREAVLRNAAALQARSQQAQSEIERLMQAPATLETVEERLAHLEELAPLVSPGSSRSLTTLVAAVAFAEARLAAHGVGKAPEALAFVGETAEECVAAIRATPFSSVAALLHRAVDAARAEAADLALSAAVAPPVPPSPRARALDVVNGRWILRVDGVERGLKRRRSEPGTRDTDLRAAQGGRVTGQSKWLLALALRSQGQAVNLPRYQDWSRLVAALREVDVAVDESSDEPRLAARLELGEEAGQLARTAGLLANRP